MLAEIDKNSLFKKNFRLRRLSASQAPVSRLLSFLEETVNIHRVGKEQKKRSSKKFHSLEKNCIEKKIPPPPYGGFLDTGLSM